MGIKGLETFLYEYQIGYYESIVELVQKYRNNRRNADFPDTKDVKIVVDANTCQQVAYKLADHFVGYEIQEYVNRLREFVEDFKKLGIELVFFFSDSISVEEERRGNIANVRKTLECLVTKNYLPNSYHLTLPSSRFTSASILKYVLGCEVRYVTTKSSREAILEYIQENQCFAILTDNTEFMACQTDTLVLSSHHLRRTDMNTIRYNRVVLANALRIHAHELPLFAILAGSDTDISSEIEAFHRKCVSHHLSYCLGEIPVLNLFEEIVVVIHKLRKYEHTYIEIILDVLGSHIMVSLEKKDLFKKDYYSYFLPNTYRFSITSFPTDHWSSLLMVAENRYRACIISTDVYTVLSEQRLNDILTFDDLSNATLVRDQPSFTVLQPLRQRLYGILLSEKKSSLLDPVTVQEWKYGAEFCLIPIVVAWPIKPVVPHPGLMALWHEFNDNINRVRWTLFLKTISPSLDVARWQSLDEELLFPTLSVYHLYDIKYLNESEVDAVLVTIATCGLPVEVLPDASFDIRVCNISIALYRTFTLVLNILAACGHPVQLSENNAYLKFESRLFQFNYAATMEKKADTRTLCQNHDYCYYKFKRMKDIINETENDKLSDDLARMEV